MAGELLIEQGHQVVFHARNQKRAQDVKTAVPKAHAVLVGDLSSLAQMKSVAEQANRLGTFDAIIHNAAVGYQEPKKIETEDGLAHVFAINTLAPYVLTALIHPPGRLIYLSSGLHHTANTSMEDITWSQRPWRGTEAYAESKFHDVLLAFAVARLFPKILSNSLEPGWVPTKMGGANAPDDLDQGHRTQAWLAVSDDPAVLVSGQYFFHHQLRACNPAARDIQKQEKLLNQCAEVSGIELGRG
jgi:NAD(P)-dependent dehydrogenase (short-subunit alcohol dehydrogenase family)